MQTTKPITATAIETTRDGLVLTLANRQVRIPWECCSQKLASATELDRTTAELSPGGYGIHWPLLDEDLSVGGLVRDAREIQGHWFPGERVVFWDQRTHRNKKL